MAVSGSPSTCPQDAPAASERHRLPNSTADSTICRLTGFTARASFRPPNRLPDPTLLALTSFTAGGTVKAAAERPAPLSPGTTGDMTTLPAASAPIATRAEPTSQDLTAFMIPSLPNATTGRASPRLAQQ